MIGAALAYADGVFHAPSVCVAFLGALLIQIGTNFCNDYADFKKGADTAERIGPLRATQAGLISPRAMLIATILVFGLAVACSAYLIFRGGWPVVLIGVFSILSGVLYTAGPYPLGYLGLGDLFVLIFFGPVAVAGSVLLFTGTFVLLAVYLGWALGFLAAAILVANNLRDLESDSLVGKRTLAVRFGRHFSRVEYTIFLLIALLIAVSLPIVTVLSIWSALGVLTLVLAIPVLKCIWTRESPEELIPALGQTAKLMLVFSVLTSIGILI